MDYGRWNEWHGLQTVGNKNGTWSVNVDWRKWDETWSMKSIMKQPYDKNDNTRKTPEELRRICLKMVPGDTSKGAAIL